MILHHPLLNLSHNSTHALAPALTNQLEALSWIMPALRGRREIVHINQTNPDSVKVMTTNKLPKTVTTAAHLFDSL